MIAVGENKANIYHGDQHPAELYETHEIKTTGKNLFDVFSVIPYHKDRLKLNFDGSLSTFDYYCQSKTTLKEMCPTINVGETLRINAISEAEQNFVYIPNITAEWFFGQPLTITENILNSKVAFYGYYNNSPNYKKEAKIYNIQIYRSVETPPYEPYTGGKPGIFKETVKYSGFDIPIVTGAGRVEIGEQPYKAALPEVKVYGKGEQEKLEGKNLALYNPNFEFTDPDGLVIKAVNNMYLLNGYIGHWLHTYVIDVEKNFTLPIGDYIVRPWYSVPIQGLGFRIWRDDGYFEATYELKFRISTQKPIKIQIIGNPEVTYNNVYLGITISVDPMSEFEPYCGGIPAPNPEYPIQPKFVENAEVQCVGRNLINLTSDLDQRSCVIKPDKSVQIRINNWYYPTILFYPKDFPMYVIKPGTVMQYRCENVPFNYRFEIIFWGKYSDGEKYFPVVSPLGGTTITFTIPKTLISISYIELRVARKPGNPWTDTTTIIKNIQLELGTTPTPYEPYYSCGTAKLPILRALPDGSVKDEIDIRTGTVTRRIKELVIDKLFGWQTWGANKFVDGTTGFFNYMINDYKPFTPSISSHFIKQGSVVVSEGFYQEPKDGKWTAFLIPNRYLENVETNQKALSSFGKYLADQKSAGHPVTIWYPLETPIIEHYDPAILRQHPGYTQLIQSGGELQADISAKYYKSDVPYTPFVPQLPSWNIESKITWNEPSKYEWNKE